MRNKQNWKVCPCAICHMPMTRQQLVECVYWAPRMGPEDLKWAIWFSEFEIRQAHRSCWKNLSSGRQEVIRLTSLKHKELDGSPKSMGQYV